MINNVLSSLAQELDAYFRNTLGLDRSHVILSSILSQDGTVIREAENKIVMTLVNIEEGKAFRNNPLNRQVTPKEISLTVLMSSYFNNYEESLKFISMMMDFFGDKNVFTPQTTPASRITVTLQPATLAEMSTIWSLIGAKYVPSLLYTVTVNGTQH